MVTNLHPFSGFHLAEGYHQKYMLRNNMSLLIEYEAKYPDVDGMVSSTATARVNGYLGGNGTCDQLTSEISGFGLSESGREKLLKEVCTGIKGKLCPSNNCSSN
jgi:peptide-methionine (S)-S-oxide reductase